MLARILVLLTVLTFLFTGAVYAGTFQRLNPYAPMNATAAAPLTPYNLDEYPQCSNVLYPPCPGCGPPGTLLPDIPPINQAFRGPLGCPVPVP